MNVLLIKQNERNEGTNVDRTFFSLEMYFTIHLIAELNFKNNYESL